MSKNIALFGGSFNPPGVHHRAIAEHLSHHFDEVIVVPCGPRPDKPVTNDVEPIYRAAMVDMTFRSLPRVRVELFDLEARTFTRTHQLDEQFRAQGRIWHVVGANWLEGGRSGKSLIHRHWEKGSEVWQQCHFAVIQRPGHRLDAADLPAHHRIFEIAQAGSSSEIRDKVFHRQPIHGLVLPEVARYMERHGLYRGTVPIRSTRFELDVAQLMVIVDERNSQACELAAGLPSSDESNPNLIVVIGGDGTMLRAIRQHWRRRVPFYGINAGHMGFLLNNEPPMLERELMLHQLPLLWVETENSQGVKNAALAFNDAWVERATGQTAWIQAKVNGQERLPHFMADGALVSTAAGSTSYARAMGATPVPFNTPVMLLVGSNVLKPDHWKPAVLPLDSTVELATLDPVKRPLRGYIDGVPQGEVHTMRARVSNIAAVELAFDPRYDAAEKLARIQFPPLAR